MFSCFSFEDNNNNYQMEEELDILEKELLM